MDNNNVQIGNWFLDQLAVYQTANSDYQTVKNNFVIRKAEYNTIIDAIINKKTKDPLQHELILGRRGSGKSTLLKRIEIEIVENPELNKKFIAINLAEEQAGIYRLFDLWEQVIYELNKQNNFDIHITDYNNFDTDQAYTRHLFALIQQSCTKNNKRIVLLLDNFDRIVENFTDDGSLLRETLINYNSIEIIAGSTRMDEHFWKYDKPFYEFFRTHKLEALSREEMNTLLAHWSLVLNMDSLKGFVMNNHGKIENIRILTDGLPRTLQFFIQIVLQKSESNTYDYLKKTMDNASPLFQERLINLTPQLRKIVYEMAFIWEACTTKQLVEKAKMESKLISANLKTLVEKGIVDKIETNKKQHLYRISERFFNMWLIVTQGNPDQKRKAKWLSIFLENWYDASDFRKLATEHIARLSDGKIDWKSTLLFSKGLCQSKYISVQERDTIIELTERLKANRPENDLIELPEKYEDIVVQIQEFFEKKEYNKVIEIAENIENEEDGIKFIILGLAYANLQKISVAESFYLKAIDKGQIDALNNLANLYGDLQKFSEAESLYLKDIEKGNTNAFNNSTILNEEQQNFSEAECYYLNAFGKGNIIALHNLAILHYITNTNKAKALEYVNKAIETDQAVNLKETQIIVEIWNGIFNNIENRAAEIIESQDITVINELLFDLLVQQQKRIVLHLFENVVFGKELQEKYTILYYVTLILNKVPDDNLLLKIPPELQSTIDAILTKIETNQKLYGY